MLLTASAFKKQTILIVVIMIAFMFTLHANLSLIENDENFKNAKRKQEKRHRNTKSNSQKKHDDRGDNITILIDAIRKMYNGGHLNRDYAKYILLQGRDMMAKLPSFYNISLPKIYNDLEERSLSKKRITVRSCLCFVILFS